MNKFLSQLAGVLLAAAPVAAMAETVQVAHPFPENGAQGRIDRGFTDEITAATNGDIEFQFFWAGSLGAGNEIVHLIRDGAIEYGVAAPAYYASECRSRG
jgi:TRAP-type C4-dicarboxylate transport system, periplasmic component